jgi:hypothetical protein
MSEEMKALIQKALASSNEAYTTEFDRRYYGLEQDIETAMKGADFVADEAYHKTLAKG